MLSSPGSAQPGTEPPQDDFLMDSFRRTARRACSTRLRRFLQAPFRTLAVKGVDIVGARTGLNYHLWARTFWRERMLVRIPEAVSNQIVRYGLTEPGLTAFMLQLLRPGQVFIDVGAHFGYFTVLGARLVGDGGHVHAFEPTPSTFEMLRTNAGWRRGVVLNQSAVWSRPQRLAIRDFGGRLSAFNSAFAPRLSQHDRNHTSETSIEVSAVALDDYCAARDLHPQFVKIDAESAEWHIISGMERLLNADRPAVTVEVGDFDIEGAPASVELLDVLIMRGYQPFEFHDGSIRRHVLRDRYEYDNILLVPGEKDLVRVLSSLSM